MSVRLHRDVGSRGSPPPSGPVVSRNPTLPSGSSSKCHLRQAARQARHSETRTFDSSIGVLAWYVVPKGFELRLLSKSHRDSVAGVTV